MELSRVRFPTELSRVRFPTWVRSLKAADVSATWYLLYLHVILTVTPTLTLMVAVQLMP